MGIDDGKLMVGISRKSRLNTLNELRGQTLGVDINLWLYDIISANKSMLMKLFMDPIQDITFDLHSELDKRCNIFRSSGICLFYVFDGVPNPRKAHTNAKRKEAAGKALDELKLLLKDTVNAENKKIITLAIKSLRIDEDITSKVIEYCKKKSIPYIQAAFEADPQLYMLEKLGIVDGIISEDSDYIYLGCKLFVCDTIFKIEEGVMNCNIVRHDNILQFLKEKLNDRNNFLVSEDLALLGTLLGSDFHKFDPKHHVGIKKATDIMIEYIGQKSSSSMNIDLLVNIVKNKLTLWSSAVEEDNFKLGIHSLLYGVCWSIQSKRSTTSARDASCQNFSDLCKVELVSMRPMPPVHKHNFRMLYTPPPFQTFAENVNYYLGFDLQNPQLFSGSIHWNNRKTCHSIATFCVCGKTNEKLVTHKYAHPRGSVLNFKSIHPTNVPKSLLILWLHARGIPIVNKSMTSKKEIVDLVNKSLELGDKCKVLETSHGHSDSSDYLTFSEAIKGCEQDNEIRWQTNLSDIVSVIKRLPEFNDLLVNSIFGDSRPGVEERAHNLLTGGHYDLVSLKQARCKIQRKGSTVECNVFCVTCLPSVKLPRYDVMLLFEEVNGSFVRCPFSRCSCEAGRLFCSHMLGMLELLVLGQKVGTQIKNILRKPIEEIREPVSLDMYTDHYYRKKNDKATLELLKSVKKQLQPKFDAVANDHDLPVTSDDDSIEEAGDDDDSIDKVEVQGRRKKDDRFSHSAEVNEVLEFLSHSEANSGNKSNRDSIIDKVCAFANSSISVKEEPSFKVNLREEELVNKNIKLIQRGPSSSRQEKIEQLELLNRLYYEYFETKSLELNMLAFYVFFTKADRDTLLGLLRNESNELICIATGTSKIPAGWYILSDRGFADDTAKYRNLNPILCPTFLDGRAQFTYDDIKKDIPLCKLRYSSECIFSRVTDIAICSGTIPVVNFEIFNEAVAWAHGRSNLQQPYYKPAVWDEFVLETRGPDYLNYLQRKKKKHELYTWEMYMESIKKRKYQN